MDMITSMTSEHGALTNQQVQPGQMAMMNQRGQMVGGPVGHTFTPGGAPSGMMGPRPGMQYMGGPSPGGVIMPQVRIHIV